MEQKLGSTRLPGGTAIAYATAGSGPLLLFIGGWLSHLELSWALPANVICSRASRTNGPSSGMTGLVAASRTGRPR